MDEFRKSKLKERNAFDLDARKHLLLSKKYLKWAKKKSNHIARQRLKEELKNESDTCYESED